MKHTKFTTLASLVIAGGLALTACGDDSEEMKPMTDEGAEETVESSDTSMGDDATDDADDSMESDMGESEDSDSDDAQAEGGQGENSEVWVNDDNPGVVVKMTYYYGDNNIVTQQDTETTVDYEESGTSEDTMKPQMDELHEEYSSVEGVTHNVDYQEDGLVETMSVDYSVADVSEVLSMEGSSSTQSEGQEITHIEMEQSRDLLKQQGFEKQ